MIPYVTRAPGVALIMCSNFKHVGLNAGATVEGTVIMFGGSICGFTTNDNYGLGPRWITTSVRHELGADGQEVIEKRRRNYRWRLLTPLEQLALVAE